MPDKRELIRRGLPVPRVGERVVSVCLFGRLGAHGKREEGYTDPARQMVWVRWDDGSLEGEFLTQLVREEDWPKTLAYKVMHEG